VVWAKVALASGLLLLFAAFGLGTQPRSASVRHVPYDCGATIAASWLAPGSPDLTPGPAAPADERRAAAACGHVIYQSRVAMFSAMGLGGLIALMGWTAIGERRDRQTRQAMPSHA